MEDSNEDKDFIIMLFTAAESSVLNTIKVTA